MTYVVAVSGGVDSVVLLDMLVHEGAEKLIVAHFDHGIRADSAADAWFVAGLAELYGLPFETKREELGAMASEETARLRRYEFLRSVAAKHNAQLVTAHHGDDAVESIAINLVRGTGWRGLAVMGDNTIYRPLLGFTKQQLYDYAVKHNLEWVEDETNASTKYLRNRLRFKTRTQLPADAREQLLRLRQIQLQLRDEIEKLATGFVASGAPLSRYFYIMLPTECALELLRHATNKRLTTPQLKRVLIAIKTARPGTVVQPGGGVIVQVTKRDFVVKTP